MGRKENEYQKGRLDGLDMALRIAKDGGVEALEKEVRIRGAWGIHTPLVLKELDYATDTIKRLTYQTVLIAALSVLKDNFGFGQIRCQRFVDGFEKLTAYLHNGWMYWFDVIEEIKSRMNLDMEISALSKDSMGRTWAHPEPEDIYTEQDFVDPNFWTAMLKANGFREITKDTGEHAILDETGEEWFIYDNAYDKIGVYDAMQGVLWAKEHYGIIKGDKS